MPIPVTCAKCGFDIKAPDHVAGRTLRCFKCLTPFTVPKAAPVAQFVPSLAASPAPMAAFPDSPPAATPPEPVAAPEFELTPEPAGEELMIGDLDVIEEVPNTDTGEELVDLDEILMEEEEPPAEPPAKKKKKGK
jgi:hypothetical protein